MVTASPPLLAYPRYRSAEAAVPRLCHLQEDEATRHFAILIYDEPDSAVLRDQHRQTHLDYLKVSDAQTLFAGPFTTEISIAGALAG
jgi:hypothetical protein